MKVIQSRSCDHNNVLCMSDPHNLPQFRSKINCAQAAYQKKTMLRFSRIPLLP